MELLRTLELSAFVLEFLAQDPHHLIDFLELLHDINSQLGLVGNSIYVVGCLVQKPEDVLELLLVSSVLLHLILRNEASLVILGLV